MTAMETETTLPPKAGSYPCDIEDAGGRCGRDAIIQIFNLDANQDEEESMSARACGRHTDRGFQEAGARGMNPSPEFRVVPLGSLAERIRVLVPVGAYLP